MRRVVEWGEGNCYLDEDKERQEAQRGESGNEERDDYNSEKRREQKNGIWRRKMN